MKNVRSLVCLFIFLSVKVNAQSDTVITIQQSTDKYKVETNRFFDNCFFGVGVGAQMYMGDHNRQMKFEDRVTPVGTVYIGKWFTPGMGLRLNFSGGEFKGVTQNGSFTTGVSYDDSQFLEEQNFKHGAIRADVLFNATNLIMGYKDNRVYSFIPYIGAGWAFTKDAREVTLNMGLLNKFRLSSAWDFNLDISLGLVNDRFDGEVGGAKDDGFGSVTVGFAYKFKKRTWDRSKTKVLATTAYSSAMPTVVSMQAPTPESCDVPEKTIERITHATPAFVTFVIDKSELRNEAKQNLKFLAESLKEINSGVFMISGYADDATGSESRNAVLSRERAEIVYRMLIEYGVPASMLQIEYHGGVKNMFFDDPALSRSVIIKNIK